MSAALKPVPPESDPDAERLAQVAAKIIQRVGEDAVHAHLPRTAVRAPAPAVAVLACACGQVLDAADMRWVGNGRRYGNGDPKIGRIVCPPCASSPLKLRGSR